MGAGVCEGPGIIWVAVVTKLNLRAVLHDIRKQTNKSYLLNHFLAPDEVAGRHNLFISERH